ncbi:hypothetical protein NLG97_g10395 [Lecanicillium saksenae]|uniref:Uncharacterized protein n=1 Tax=Lecanicillium saksenae TaxID=468837 RepID=A0ACC1QEM9_9HYPO|nr:hypothetical protein NLG97_g10395 [Lecanicillium saksenae]
MPMPAYPAATPSSCKPPQQGCGAAGASFRPAHRAKSTHYRTVLIVSRQNCTTNGLLRKTLSTITKVPPLESAQCFLSPTSRPPALPLSLSLRGRLQELTPALVLANSRDRNQQFRCAAPGQRSSPSSFSASFTSAAAASSSYK